MRINLITYILFALVFGVSAQELSYYSRYGFGSPQAPTFANNKAMGDIIAVYNDVFHINMANPASYAKNTYVNFSFGNRFTSRAIATGDTSVRAGDANIEYLAMSFPIFKKPTYNDNFEVINQTPKIGGSFGLMPYFQSNYSHEVSLTYNDSINYFNLFNTVGKLYRFYGGLGGVVFEDSTNTLSIGANVNYIFGKINQGEIILIPNDINIFSTRKRSQFKTGGFAFDFGVQYTRHLKKWEQKQKNNNQKKELFIVTGAYAHLPRQLNSNLTTIVDRYRIVSGLSSNIDTFSNVELDDIKVAFPSTYGFGFTINQVNNSKSNRLIAGVDFSYSTWSAADQPLGITANYRDAWKIGAGLQFSPNTNNNGKFFKTANYRLGGYYDNGYLSINGTDISEFGITFGIAKPVIKKVAKQFKSKVILVPQAVANFNFSFQVGQIGTTANNLYKETFFRASIAVDLYGNWFIKAKYD